MKKWVLCCVTGGETEVGFLNGCGGGRLSLQGGQGNLMGCC